MLTIVEKLPMLNSRKNLVVVQKIFLTKKYIYIKARGILKTDDVNLLRKKTEKILKATKVKRHVFVCDFLQLQDYQTEAREMLQELILHKRQFVRHIFVVSQSPIIFAGVEIVSFFSTIPIRVVNTLEKIKDILRNSA